MNSSTSLLSWAELSSEIGKRKIKANETKVKQVKSIGFIVNKSQGFLHFAFYIGFVQLALWQFYAMQQGTLEH